MEQSDIFESGFTSLIIPIFNESGHLLEFLKAVDEVNIGSPKELIFIDDFSTDGSRQILMDYPFRSRVQKIYQEVNQGKGAALKRGIQAATGEFILVQDADFEYDLRDIPAVLEPLRRGAADVVYGSRFRKSGTQIHRTFHYLVNRFLTLLSNIASGLYLSDMETCYKAFKSEIIKNIKLTSNRFGFEPEVTAKLGRLAVRVEEIPIRYFPRNYLQGKKITWKDGLAAVWHIFKFNFMSSSSESYTPQMPSKYLISGRQWL